MDKIRFNEIAQRRDYYMGLMSKKEGIQQSMKFDMAIDRMLYCNIRGLEDERNELFTKIDNKIKEFVI